MAARTSAQGAKRYSYACQTCQWTLDLPIPDPKNVRPMGADLCRRDGGRRPNSYRPSACYLTVTRQGDYRCSNCGYVSASPGACPYCSSGRPMVRGAATDARPGETSRTPVGLRWVWICTKCTGVNDVQ